MHPISKQPQRERQPDDLESADALRRTLSVAPATAVDAPPDGGLAAWMSVLACFFAIMNTWGLIVSFGVFQTTYVNILDESPSDIAWIGSIAVFLLFFIGVFSGGLTDIGYFRSTTNVGAFLILLGTFMTSLSKSYWQLILAQGVCIGLGNGFLLTPMMAVTVSYFRKKLPIVMGIAACGSTTGGLIFPSMARTLLPSVGFPWAVRAMGFVQMGTLAIALLAVRPMPSFTNQSRSIIDWAAFKEAAFIYYTAGAFLSYLGVFVPFFFLTSYARDIRGMSYLDSLNLLLILNGIGIIGRLMPSIFARYFGTLNVFVIMLALTSLAMFIWIAVDSTPGLYIWTVYYTLVVGGVQSLFPASTAVVSLDLRNIGSRLGIVSAAIGTGALIGSPVSGVLITATGGDYVAAQAFGGSTLVLGALLVFASREIRRRQNKRNEEGIWAKL